jgi:ribonuclease P protein component
MAIKVLRRPWQFRLVYRDGQRVSCKYAVLFYHRSNVPNGGPFFGFVASRRVGNAVKRNRAKRLLREAIRTTITRFKNGSLWVVLVARATLLDADHRDLIEDLENVLVGEELIQGSPPS